MFEDIKAQIKSIKSDNLDNVIHDAHEHIQEMFKQSDREQEEFERRFDDIMSQIGD